MGTTPWEQFDNAATISKNSWNANQNRNFGSAYERAKEKYLETIKAQENQDKADSELRGALVMLAFSLAGGSVLTALFGKASMKSVAADLASDAVLKVTIDRGWERAFNALAWTTSNAAAKFVMGALWDQMESKVSEKVKAAISKLPAKAELSTSHSQMKGVVEFQNQLLNFTDSWESAVRVAGQEIHDLGGPAKLAEFKKASPFFHPPKTAVDIDQTARRMELSFWMKFILERDYLETGVWEHHPTGRDDWGMRRVVTSRTVIGVSPHAKNYPVSSQKWSFGAGSYSSVSYSPIGAVIKKRIDELHGIVIRGLFFKPGLPGYGDASLQSLKQAEQTLVDLAAKNATLITKSLGL